MSGRYGGVSWVWSVCVCEGWCLVELLLQLLGLELMCEVLFAELVLVGEILQLLTELVILLELLDSVLALSV